MADEHTQADALQFHLTGAGSDGGAQTDPDASLGNYRSGTLAESLGVAIANPISNITVDLVAGANGTGTGTLEATGADTLRWTPPSASGGTQSADVTITNGQTKIIPAGTVAGAYIKVSRTSATALSGTATLTLTDQLNNLFGMDNVATAESVSGDTEYRGLMMKNENGSGITNLKVWIGTLGTQATSDAAQLSGSGAGTIQTTGDLSDWPDAGFAHIRTSGGTTREIVYYSSRTDTTLTVPAAGRSQLGTTAAAGASDDTIDAVPGIRIASEAPSSDAIQTIADESTAPTGRTWNTGLNAAGGVNIGSLAAGALYGLWIERTVPAGIAAASEVLHLIEYQYDI